MGKVACRVDKGSNPFSSIRTSPDFDANPIRGIRETELDLLDLFDSCLPENGTLAVQILGFAIKV